MQFEFWDIATNPAFVITFALVLGFFAPVAYSLWETWNKSKSTAEDEQ